MALTTSTGRNTNAVMPNVVDRGPWFVYDTVQVAAGSAVISQYNLVSVPIGQQNPWVSGTQKSKLQTNMTLSNSFSPPKCMLVQRLGFYPSSRMLKADWDNIIDNCYMEFKIDDKIFHEGQLYMFPPGAGMSGLTTQSGIGAFNNGLPSVAYSRNYGDWAKYIAPLQNFTLNIFFPGTTPTMDPNGIGWYMPTFIDGINDRPVQ